VKVNGAKQANGKKADDERDANEATPTGKKAVIKLYAGEHSSIATKTEKMLFNAGVPLYQRSDALMRPIIKKVDASHAKTTKVAQLKELNTVYLRDLTCRHADFLRYDGRSKSWKKVIAPINVAATILARVGEWTFPTIAGVITTPTLRPDGSLLADQGYDDPTRLLLVEPSPMPSIPGKPTKAHASLALALLEDLLREFPFVDTVAKSVALSGMITPVVRGAFPVSPMHVSRAPVAGSGKSFLWDIVATIAIGRLMPVIAAGRNEEETEKRLGAALLAGQPLISIDNLNGELGGDALCQIIERPIVDIRILGKSELKRIEARGTTMFGSGNNIVIVGDACRRVITATLDPQLEQPELRNFSSDPVAKVLENRGAYIAACLTICRAYIAAGRPNLAPKLASFEGWSDTVRSALIWLGKADPVASMELARAEDPERGELRDMLSAWSDAIGVGSEHRLTLADVIEMATKTMAGFNSNDPEHPELYAAVQAAAYAVTGKRGQQADAKLLGLWLQRRKGRVVDGMRFANQPNPKGASTWWIESVVKQQSQPAPGTEGPSSGGKKPRF
jgi:hypothetical protein